MPNDEWDRVEPHTRLDQLEEGLQARTADPLWMLARQWQLGEFRGEDAASPVHTRVRVESTPVRSFRNESVDGAAAQRLRGALLEAEVEAEVPDVTPGGLRLRAEAGLQLLRRLEAAGQAGVRERLTAQFPLPVPEGDEWPDRMRRTMRLWARRAFDGLRVARAGATELAAAGLGTVPRSVIEAWRAELDGRFVEPEAPGDSWADERLEYAFSLGARPHETDSIVLQAHEHAGGHLDWFSFDLAAEPSGHEEVLEPKRSRRTLELAPVPLAYGGMPASRYWEFEEGAIYFGGIEAGPADIGRLVVAEFALVYSDDWFLLPVRFRAGELARVRSIDVWDTFGDWHPVRSTAAEDAAELGDARRPWAFWELSGDPSADAGESPWLYLAPAVVAPVGGDALERVVLVRDEGANLAWGIESIVEGPTGRPVARRQLWNPPAAPERTESHAWRYRLQPSIPPWWVPFQPERQPGGGAEMRLRRARMLAWDELDTPFKGALGRIMAPERPLRLYEEEVPRGGVEVTRAWRYARGDDGRPVLWLSRTKRPGRGDRASGLGFDTIETE